MSDFFNKFKIPTFLGLGIILIGIASGVFLVLREQTFLSKAAPTLTPQNITLTNISDDTITISWQTSSLAPSFITFGQNSPSEKTVLDERDENSPKPQIVHSVAIKNLLPKTTYQFKIFSGKLASDILKFTTASPIINQTGFTPIIGSVLDGNSPLDDGIVYLSIQGATTQSALIKEGNFLIPLSQIRTTDLADTFKLAEGTTAKLTIYSEKGNSSASFKLKPSSRPLPSIKLGQNIDLIIPEETPESIPIPKELDKFDLNSDGKMNAADNAIILQNFGKNPKNLEADLNGDKVVNQKDLNLMSERLKDLGSQ